MSLCGPEGYVRDRIAAFREAGVTDAATSTPSGPTTREADRDRQELALSEGPYP